MGTEQNKSGNRPRSWHSGIHTNAHQTGSGQTGLYIAATMAATPFLQAVATHFGTKLAGGIDEATRAALRLFLRRQVPIRPVDEINLEDRHREEEQAERVEILKLQTDRGWRVEFGTDLPAEGLAQLLAIEGGPPPGLDASPAPLLTWQPDRSVWSVLGVSRGLMMSRVWDATTNSWSGPQ
ncbi:hypothetical protein ACWCO9_23000 [Streptomyces sp. NPDC001937]